MQPYQLCEVIDARNMFHGQRGIVESVESEKVTVTFHSWRLGGFPTNVFHESQVGPLTTVKGYEVLTRRALGLRVRLVPNHGPTRFGTIETFVGGGVEVKWDDKGTLTVHDREWIETCTYGWSFLTEDVALIDVNAGDYLIRGGDLLGEVASCTWDADGLTVDLVRPGGTVETQTFFAEPLKVAVRA